jgi:NAD(P)-dependent dehydrogenase (short-subunit alcohol dehydrogenase family)
LDSFDARTAVITGGGSGIGLGLAFALARQGANVVIADINGERAADAAAQLREATGVRTIGIETDVSDAASVEALADTAFTTFGNVHVLANNAGVTTIGLSWESSLENWSLAIGVNLMGVVHGTRAFLPRMIAGGEPGHIANTSSMAGLIPIPLQAPYVASKHAVVGFTQSLQQELQSVGAPIGVSVVCPGRVATNINADTRRRTEEEAAGEVTAQTREILGQLSHALESGMSGTDAGQVILEAIRSDRFWVFPNAQEYFPLVKQIHESMFDTVDGI